MTMKLVPQSHQEGGSPDGYGGLPVRVEKLPRLAWWSHDIFTMDTAGLRTVLNYGLPAVMYLLLGHGIAARLNRA
ncbi:MULTISPECIES: hypothetical protein [Streptomyces]|uniref:Uncharacterized protein n=1 Tax=Streptomyces dengpaensis TaxID=2049881 RepID=A0ABN5HZT6_9ACTN|nr:MULTISPECIES: hypothetical protein [Streptomyces]AVH56504.1 hypothetical protein C4B68_12805 [Streptomyces dengpaensis]PIB10471.1 hypothetical protein B1C81_08305 [Streptomyces sp. HG99]